MTPPAVPPGDQAIRKGQTLTARISSLAHGGEGVTKDHGLPIFVNRVAPGDLVELRVFDARKEFAKAEVLQLLEPSPWRAEPPCPLFKVCGGCQWQHLGYEHQLEAKTDIVRQAIKHIGKLDDEQLVQPTIAAVKSLNYRNKAQFPAQSVKKTGRILAGYYKQNSHDLVNIKHCPVQPEPMDRVLETAKEVLQEAGITGYDEEVRKGQLRHIAERYSFAGNQILLTLVLNMTPPIAKDIHASLVAAAARLMERVPEVSGVCANFNDRGGNRIMGDTTIKLAGSEHLTETLHSALPHAPQVLRDGLKFRLSSTSFFQINSQQAALLFDQVLLAATGQLHVPPQDARFDQQIPLVIDAYAGVGTMGMWLSPIGRRIVAIEEMASAVADGRVNLELNNLSNMEFVEDRVENQVPKLVAAGEPPDVVVIDPPRKGMENAGLRSLIELSPKRIVYVSCNPATLARDLRKFQDAGYKTKRIQPIDMFPQTYHVESVSVLEKAPS